MHAASAVVVLKPEESRRLIGRAVAQLLSVQHAKARGRLVVVGGGTTRFVAESLTGEDPGLESYAVGWVKDGELGETPKEERGPGPHVWENGELSRVMPFDVIKRFTAGDVYIKGANAIDAEGHVGILMASPVGGTIGLAYPIIMARGCELIMAVSLAKQVPSVLKACELLGQQKGARTMGTPVGMMPIPRGTATVVTEIEAFEILYGLEATLVAAGGVGDCEGALIFHLKGEQGQVDRFFS
uniref:Uncharacterized protein n=1 Tax=Magnetococcus massalia (strain MO-1) TaxID=451514 RepID=A0A1S7LHS4_MAGMO|nr:conserved protein of unknown function [Candidatus Magnetococcus massalia]